MPKSRLDRPPNSVSHLLRATHLSSCSTMQNREIVPESFGYASVWSDVLASWLQFLERYEVASKEAPDLAYWHVEQSLTGLLGAAAWSERGWSLEAFGS